MHNHIKNGPFNKRVIVVENVQLLSFHLHLHTVLSYFMLFFFINVTFGWRILNASFNENRTVCQVFCFSKAFSGQIPENET